MSFARFELVEDVRVVHLDGCAADDDLGEAVAVLADHTGPTILDLDDVTLVGGHVDELVSDLVERCDAVCVVARRRTARQILHRTGVSGRCAVFPSLRDALASLGSSAEVRGGGWAGAGVSG